MNKSKLASINIILMVAGCIICVAICLISYSAQISEYKAARANYDEIKDVVLTTDSKGDIAINFELLSTKTFDSVCSWISIPGTVVDYPLVQANDNDTYLHIDAYGNESSAGAIFLNSYNNPDMNDPYSIIFGHSMKDGSMFHILHDFEDEEYAHEHQTLYVYMKDGSYRTYHALCVISANAYDKEIYTVSPDDDPVEKATMLVNKADHVYNNQTDGRVIALSTCVRDNNRRIVVFQET